MIWEAIADKGQTLGLPKIKGLLQQALKRRSLRRVLIIPPDFTRYHSQAGLLTEMVWEILGEKVKAVLPALGTHRPMTLLEQRKMFGTLPSSLMVAHEWRQGLYEAGRLPAEEIRKLSGGLVSFDWPVQYNPLLRKDWDLILSIGQVVPHEVAGMANYTKNIAIGVGGKEGIDKSHYLGALCGMEFLMGRPQNPVRELLNRGVERFCQDLPLVYIHSVIGRESSVAEGMRGLFIGDDEACYTKAAELAIQENITLLDKPLQRVIVHLPKEGCSSTWLGNKAIYRSRMAIADGGELIILAPGVRNFGESPPIDKIIRRYGYRGRDYTLQKVKEEAALEENLSVAAHLIHGSSEDRFQIRYCPGKLSQREIEEVGYLYGDLAKYQKYYSDSQEGFNSPSQGREEYFYIANPASGLWALKEDFPSR